MARNAGKFIGRLIDRLPVMTRDELLDLHLQTARLVDALKSALGEDSTSQPAESSTSGRARSNSVFELMSLLVNSDVIDPVLLSKGLRDESARNRGESVRTRKEAARVRAESSRTRALAAQALVKTEESPHAPESIVQPRKSRG